MFRLIAEIKPKWVIGENVQGFVNQPMGLARTVSDLESEGYEVRSFVIPACAVQAPHERKRVWIVAHSICGQDHSKRGVDRFGGGALEWRGQTAQQENRASGADGVDGRCNTRPDDVAHALSDTKGSAHGCDSGSGRNRRQEPNISERDKVGGHAGNSSQDVAYPKSQRVEGGRAFGEQESRVSAGEGISGCDHSRCGTENGGLEPELGRVADGVSSWLDGHFDIEPDIPRVATGVKNRGARLKQLGNSVVPQIPEIIGRAIMAIDGQHK